MKTIILGHINPDIDSILSGYLLQKKLSNNTEFIIPDKEIDDEIKQLLLKYNIDVEQYKKELVDNKNNKYILVDHNERDLKGEIIQVIDHHPTNKPPICKDYCNEQASATICLIVQGNEEKYTKEDLELTCLGTLVDSTSFHSTSTRKKDITWVKELCKKYNFDYNKLYLDGLLLTDLSNLEKASLKNLKHYTFSSNQVESSAIQVIESVNTNNIKEMINFLRDYLIKNNLDIFLFLVHDMEHFKTTVYYITKDKIKETYYNEITSRGSIIIPELEKKLIKK